MKRLNLKIVVIEEGEEKHLKNPQNIFNKTIKENFLYLNNDMPKFGIFLKHYLILEFYIASKKEKVHLLHYKLRTGD